MNHNKQAPQSPYENLGSLFVGEPASLCRYYNGYKGSPDIIRYDAIPA